MFISSRNVIPRKIRITKQLSAILSVHANCVWWYYGDYSTRYIVFWTFWYIIWLITAQTAFYKLIQILGKAIWGIFSDGATCYLVVPTTCSDYWRWSYLVCLLLFIQANRCGSYLSTVNHITVLLHPPNSETHGEVVCIQILCFLCFPFQKKCNKQKMIFKYITRTLAHYIRSSYSFTVHGIHTSFFNSWENNVPKFTDWNQLQTLFYWSISYYFCIFIPQYIIESIFIHC
jgi:hypothetical protein